MTMDDGGTGDCVLGVLGCQCLEGACSQPNFCVENECVLGPEIEIDEPREALAGLSVPMEVEVMADEFSWSQVGGPEVEILGEMTGSIVVNLPPDLSPGDEIVLQVDATRNSVPGSETTSITILDPTFENFLEPITSVDELGTSEGIAFDPAGLMWVVSTEGFVSKFDVINGDEGDVPEFLERIDVPGMPVGATRFDENIVVANAGNASVVQINSVSGNVSTLFDSLDGGAALGAVNYPVVSPNGDIFVSNREDGQVLLYSVDEDEGITTKTVFLEGLTNPNALSFGPEGDSALYVGVQGHVLRVSVEPGGIAGTPVEYLTLPDDIDITYEVDGLAWDEGQNLWIGCPNAETLYVARYSGVDATTPIREFSAVGAGYSSFVSLSFGRDDFGEDTLYWTNLAGRTVGRLRVGLNRL